MAMPMRTPIERSGPRPLTPRYVGQFTCPGDEAVCRQLDVYLCVAGWSPLCRKRLDAVTPRATPHTQACRRVILARMVLVPPVCALAGCLYPGHLAPFPRHKEPNHPSLAPWPTASGALTNSSPRRSCVACPDARRGRLRLYPPTCWVSGKLSRTFVPLSARQTARPSLFFRGPSGEPRTSRAPCQTKLVQVVKGDGQSDEEATGSPGGISMLRGGDIQ